MNVCNDSSCEDGEDNEDVVEVPVTATDIRMKETVLKEYSTEVRKIEGSRVISEYTLIRKAVKNINMRIKPDGRVYVSAGRKVSASYIDEFVRSREQFIKEARERLESIKKQKEQKQRESEEISYITGERFNILGIRMELCVTEINVVNAMTEANDGKDSIRSVRGALTKDTVLLKENVTIENEKIMMTVRAGSSRLYRELLFKSWLEGLSRKIFEDICHKIHPLFIKYNVRYPEIRIKLLKSMWGSCRPASGIITLNAILIEKPLRCIEYVVLHEFAHFIHPDHSKNFHMLVESMMPDWKQRKKELNETSQHTGDET